MESNDLPGERWKEVPDFPGYALSTFGRLKSIKRERNYLNPSTHILKEKIKKPRVLLIDKKQSNFVVTLNMSREGTNYTFSIARYVYYLFVKAFDLNDRSIIIKKSDGNYLNCHYQNLRLETPMRSLKQSRDELRQKEKRGLRFPIFNTRDLSLPGEEWKVIPGLKKRYLLSGYGRVKAVPRKIVNTKGATVNLKERLLKPGISLRKDNKKKVYTIYISLQKNGTFEQYSIPKLVYCLFVSRFDMGDKRLVLTRKDGNFLNCYYKNLELTTGSRLKADLYKANGTDRYFKNIIKPVSQYDKNGKWLASFKSLREASEKTGILLKHISNAMYRGQLQAGNFYWQRGITTQALDVSKFQEKNKKYLDRAQRPVQQLSMQGEVIKTFASLTDATKAMGFKSCNSIVQACGNSNRSSGGFRWRYIKKKKQDHNKKPIPVNQYALNGTFKRRYLSTTEAARKLGIVTSAIGNAIRIPSKTAKGSYWRTGPVRKKIDVSKFVQHRQWHKNSAQKAVKKISLQGNVIQTFKSISAAAESVKTSGSAIKAACSLPGKICKGFFWVYVNH